MNRKQFTFYESFFRAISRVRRKAARADIYDAICRFALYGQEPEWDRLEDTCAIALDLILPNLRSGRSLAECAVKGNVERGRIGDSPPARLSSASNPPSFRKKEKEIEIEKENESEAETEAPDREPAGELPPASVSDSSDFELFWQAYPRKAGKERAHSAFERCGQPLDQLLLALEKQKKSGQWLANGGRFIPYPATWLSECRWEDELGGEIITGPVGVLPSGHLGEAERAAIARVMAEGG